MMNNKYQDFLRWHIYQIYPRSFQDSNGDGIGDLQGIISRLDYLKDLGVNAIWLCPCYKSPNVDNGYDVADYRDIMDEFGTMEDIRELIRQLHLRDMKLIMDLVPNHTSDQHRWFQESRKGKDNPYSDYYYWYDTPPNQWGSMFGGSAYSFDQQRGQYYLHSYAPEQPDLNWENPAVVREMQAVVDFWVAEGVDGFRVDVIDQISKDFRGDRNCFGPRLHEFIHALFGRENTKHLFTVGECWADDIEEVRRHCAQDRNELSTLFQFDHQDVGREGKFFKKEDTLQSLWNRLRSWEENMQHEDLLYSLFTDNHDNSWLLSRIGNEDSLRYESATCIAAMVYLLRGVCFIYQGQEIGMINSRHETIDEFDDVESINMYDELCQTMSSDEAIDCINFGGRDNPRRPMCWDRSSGAGFTDGKPWIAMNSHSKVINLADDLSSERSVTRFYRDLLHLRTAEPALTVGSFIDMTDRPDCCCFLRQEGRNRILIICNFEKEQHIPIPENDAALLLSNYGHSIKHDDLFKPYEIAVFRL